MKLVTGLLAAVLLLAGVGASQAVVLIADDRGGLTQRMIFLRGKQLQSMYKPCYLDAQASTNKPASR